MTRRRLISLSACVLCLCLLAFAAPAAAESYGPAFDESPTTPFLPTPFWFNATVYVIHALVFLGFLGWCLRELVRPGGDG